MSFFKTLALLLWNTVENDVNEKTELVIRLNHPCSVNFIIKGECDFQCSEVSQYNDTEIYLIERISSKVKMKMQELYCLMMARYIVAGFKECSTADILKELSAYMSPRKVVQL